MRHPNRHRKSFVRRIIKGDIPPAAPSKPTGKTESWCFHRSENAMEIGDCFALKYRALIEWGPKTAATLSVPSALPGGRPGRW